jgi:hypothetical protein
MLILQKLLQLAPPPVAPIYPGRTDQWHEIQSELGINLPDDYKLLINTYGSGMFGEFVSLFNPFIPPTVPNYLHLISQGVGRLGMYEELRSNHPDFHAPFPPFPQPGGILPWGRDYNAGLACWVTSNADPNTWPTVLLDGEYSENYDTYPGTATEFIYEMLMGTVDCTAFPEDLYPIEEPCFRPGLH